MRPGAEDLLRPNLLPGVRVSGIKKSAEDSARQRSALSGNGEALLVF